MYLQAKFGVVAALLAGVLSALGLMLAGGHATSPSESEMRKALERELDRFASLEMTMCGLVLGSARCFRLPCSHLAYFQRRFLRASSWQALDESTETWSIARAVSPAPCKRLPTTKNQSRPARPA